MRLSKRLVPRLVALVIAVGIVVPATWAARLLTARPYEWQPYSDAALADAIASGRPVLIDFTATWCGNCHWVEATVLHNLANCGCGARSEYGDAQGGRDRSGGGGDSAAEQVQPGGCDSTDSGLSAAQRSAAITRWNL